MDRASSRHSLLSANLANVNTPGYKRRDSDFAIELEQAGTRSSGFESAQRKLNGTTEDSNSIRLDGNSVDLEQEVAAIAETELRYQVLTDMAGRYFSGLKNVIREGK